jgi:hypothetical protein
MTKWLRLREKLEDCIDQAEHTIKSNERMTRYPNVKDKHLIYIECYQFILGYMKLLQDDETRAKIDNPEVPQ